MPTRLYRVERKKRGTAEYYDVGFLSSSSARDVLMQMGPHTVPGDTLRVSVVFEIMTAERQPGEVGEAPRWAEQVSCV